MLHLIRKLDKSSYGPFYFVLAEVWPIVLHIFVLTSLTWYFHLSLYYSLTKLVEPKFAHQRSVLMNSDINPGHLSSLSHVVSCLVIFWMFDGARYREAERFVLYILMVLLLFVLW